MSWKPSSLDEIIRARQARSKWSDIAAEQGVSRSTLKRALQADERFPRELLEDGIAHKVSREEMLELVEVERLTDAEIAERLGLSGESSTARMRRRLNVLRRVDDVVRGRKTAEELARAEALLDDGWSYNMITKEMGMSYDTLNSHFPGRGFTKQQTAEAAVMAQRLAKIAA